jgi:hypothetical protein
MRSKLILKLLDETVEYSAFMVFNSFKSYKKQETIVCHSFKESLFLYEYICNSENLVSNNSHMLNPYLSRIQIWTPDQILLSIFFIKHTYLSESLFF